MSKILREPRCHQRLHLHPADAMIAVPAGGPYIASKWDRIALAGGPPGGMRRNRADRRMKQGTELARVPVSVSGIEQVAAINSGSCESRRTTVCTLETHDADDDGSWKQTSNESVEPEISILDASPLPPGYRAEAQGIAIRLS